MGMAYVALNVDIGLHVAGQTNLTDLIHKTKVWNSAQYACPGKHVLTEGRGERAKEGEGVEDATSETWPFTLREPFIWLQLATSVQVNEAFLLFFSRSQKNTFPNQQHLGVGSYH